jgi:hypothetical protein
MAGDTPTAGAIAGHLAACPSCTREFDELRRSSAVIRAVVASQPPADLRARTLEFVAAVGRPRGAAAAPATITSITPITSIAPVTQSEPVAFSAVAPTAPVIPIASAARRARFQRPLAWLAATAALLVLAVGLTAAVMSNLSATASRRASLEIAGLTEVATWTARLEAAPDVQHVVLTSAEAGTGGDAVGSLIFSGSSREMVVIADGLADPASGQEYGCWVEIGGTRQRLGRMYVNDDLGYWVGDSDALASVPTGSKFGVSLVDTGGSGGNQVVMSGTLQGS